jgi:hypothetical protein
MSIIGSNIIAGASGQGVGAGYTIERSLRLRSSASAYLSRTPATAGNRKTWTLSFWVKFGKIQAQTLFETRTNTNPFGEIRFGSDGGFFFYGYTGAAYQYRFDSTALFRDTSAWYHFVFLMDTTDGTAGNRTKIYVNGSQLTAFDNSIYPTQNLDTNVNNTVAHVFGYDINSATQAFDGYLTEVNFVDGQALDPSSFGEYNAETGVWQPVAYEGSYGTNGFYLPFSDNTNTTTLAADASGNGNDWTPNNISLTSGATYDSMTDTPTPYEDGGNYAVLNPIGPSRVDGGGAVAGAKNGNLSGANVGSGGWAMIGSTIAIPSGGGKFYYEFTTGGNGQAYSIGVQKVNTLFAAPYIVGFGGDSNGYSYTGDAYKWNNGGTAYGSSTVTGDVVGVAVDSSGVTASITFYKNGVSMGVAFTGITGDLMPALSSVVTNPLGAINFGQRPFAYTPPTGFLPLHTGNLPDSTIVSGDDYFKTYLYTGNGGGLQVGEIQKPFTTYEVSNSLRLRSSAPAYLNRTPASAGNLTTWTWSGWVKRGKLSEAQVLFSAGVDASNFEYFRFESSDQLFYTAYASGSQNRGFTTNAVYRDVGAWYHIIITRNGTTQKCYVNGVEQTRTSETTSASNGLFNSTNAHSLGRRQETASQYQDGYLTEVNFIDGQALTPSSFGDYDGNNYWVPKAYTGTYGTNGFYLDFSDTTSTATLVADQSGAGNDWTPNNISLTAGTTYDSMVDSPTPYADAGNYAVLNPLLTNSGFTLSNGNLDYNESGAISACRPSPATMAISSGKWYWEVNTTTVGGGSYTTMLGIWDADNLVTSYTQNRVNGFAYATNGDKVNASATASYGSAMSNADVIGVAFDADAGTITFYKNNTSQGTAFTGISGSYAPVVCFNSGGTSYSMSGSANFGQRPFAYTPPTGFKTLNSFNIPEVTTDLETPDLVWIKSRSASQSHTLFDSVRGVHNYLESDDTAIEATDVNSLLQFNKNGFLLGASAAVNTSGRTYVGWGWKANGTGVSNTDGSITSTVSANPTAGFSIVTWTGNGVNTAQSIGHGLSSAPKFLMIKSRTTGYNWTALHGATTNGTYNLNTTGAINTGWAGSSNGAFNPSNVSSTTFSTAPGSSSSIYPNQNGDNYIAYCFSEVPGYSSFGSYTGNGSTDGPFVYLGFRPAWVMWKRTNAVTDGWYITDTTRSLYNQTYNALKANSSNAESGEAVADFLSNGFKIRIGANGNFNASGGTYIYMAFAENPFKNSLAR